MPRLAVWTAAALVVSLSACATLPETGVDGVACAGAVRPPRGLRAVRADSLVALARGASGAGGTCAPRAFRTEAPLTVYRLYDSRAAPSRTGRWWALTAPAGTPEAYRAANAICPEWSDLGRLVTCVVPAGTTLVLGTTQSATCADGSVYPKTPAVQVFVPNDARAGVLHVAMCHDVPVWMPAPAAR